MINKTEKLLQIAKEFVNESTLEIIYACVGGSVARGTADKYSDLDLTVYTSTNESSIKSNIVYKGEIIQLEILHKSDLPNVQAILDSPWDYRFLAEIFIIKDDDGSLSQIKGWAIEYFRSDNGKKMMIIEVTKIVKARKLFAFDCVKDHKYYSATHASMGAWAEAGFLYLFINHHSLSTGSFIPQIQKLEKHFMEFIGVSPFSLNADLSDILIVLSEFRKYLREQGSSNEFGLSKIQDTICERKIQRLLHNHEYVNLLWQMYGEALWLYFDTSNGVPFEKYFDKLPRELQERLSKIGFVPLGAKEVQKLCSLSDGLLNLSC